MKEPKFKKGDEVWCVGWGGLFSSTSSFSVFKGVVECFSVEISGDISYKVGGEYYHENNLFYDIRDALVAIKYNSYDYIRQYVMSIEEAIKELEERIREEKKDERKGDD